MTLTTEEPTFGNSSRGLDKYEVFNVSVKSFSGTFDQIQAFLDYADSYERIVTVNNLTFKRNQITGLMDGSCRLSFYFKKAEE